MYEQSLARVAEVERREEPLSQAMSGVRAAAVEFLEYHGDAWVLGTEMHHIVGEGDGEARLARLIEAAGFSGNARAFFAEIVSRLLAAAPGSSGQIRVGGVPLPRPLLLSMLTVLIPGEGVIDVKSVGRLERLINRPIDSAERQALQEVIRRYPVRLSWHTIRQMRLSPSIAYQYLPFADELNREGLVHTWVGQFHRGIIEQTYRNRVIMLLSMICPVYCRFCFRKHKECRNQRPPTQKDVNEAVAYIAGRTEIKEVVLTGGDPFMNRATLTRAVDGLKEVPHVETLRLATRSLSYHPALFTARDGFWLNYLRRKQLELRQAGKKIEIATHFIHPDELSLASLNLISELTDSGIPVYVQTPFLGGCNDSGERLAELFSRLRSVGAEMHYVFMPCSPLQGNRAYRSDISTGLEAAAWLRGHLSDRAIPRFCTATAIGKIDWGASGWAVEVDRRDPRYLWIRTPYTKDYFETFAPLIQLSDVSRPNFEGTLDARFMGRIGDERWLKGHRTSPAAPSGGLPAPPTGVAPSPDALGEVARRAGEEQAGGWSLYPTGLRSLWRVHRTRAELDCDAEDDDLLRGLDAIAGDRRISDVVLFSQRDALRRLSRLQGVVQRLAAMPHVTAARLRSMLLGRAPEQVPGEAVRRLAALGRFSLSRPWRVEVETRFTRAADIGPAHPRLVGDLRQHGITVYANTPLLAGLNDRGDEILGISSACRRAGIEFHHLYVAGLPLQRAWGRRHPARLSRVWEIADHLRKFGSGRQLPRYVVLTEFGEVDLGLTSEVSGADRGGSVRLRLLAYTAEDLRSLDPRFAVPRGAKVGRDGHPTVCVRGLRF